jgi:hypothetical protein
VAEKFFQAQKGESLNKAAEKLRKGSNLSRLETILLSVFNVKTNQTEKVRAFLDTGSQLTVISSECAARCGLDVQGKEKVLLSTFGNKVKKHVLETTKLDFFKDYGTFEDKVTVFPYIMDSLVGEITSYELSDRQKSFLKSSNITLADPEASENGSLKVDILLGQDCLYKFHDGASFFIPGGSVLQPVWENKHSLTGPLDCDSSCMQPQTFVSPCILKLNQVKCSLAGLKNMGFTRKTGSLVQKAYACVSCFDELEVIHTFTNFEILGISPLEFSINPVHEEFNDTTTFDGKRYWVKLPFKDPQIRSLSNNFFQAFRRLLSGHKRRLRPKYAVEAEKYKKSFDDEIAMGILEKVETLGSIEEVSEKVAKNPQFFNQIKLPNGRPCCFLPHQAVYRANGKFRRVMDGKARPFKGAYSVNDCLNTGPNLTSNILHILLGWRKEKYAAQADIEKAFPQVGIVEEHRDVLRCLWIEDGKVCVYRFARLPFGLACSPFILQATLRLHLGENNVSEETLTNFIASIYVDDSLWSEPTIDKLLARKEFYTTLFRECGMNFRDWTSNHLETRENFAKLEDRDSKDENTALGMWWSTKKDLLKINATKLIEVMTRKIRTRRDIWRVVPSIYDPLGLLAPYVLLGKRITQAACKETPGWESVLPVKYVNQMQNWCSEFDKIEDISWNRWVGIENPKKVQLFGACDASSYALGACVYLVSTAQDGEIFSRLVMGKTRNATPGEQSIPRLELTAAVLLVNLMSHVRKVYNKIEDSDVFWFTDSADVLFWLFSGHLSWKPFVANQIKKIKKSCTDVRNWMHIDSKENPADLASRGESIKNLSKSDFWHCGPSYWKTGDLRNGASTLTGYDKHYKNLEISKDCYKEMQPATRRQLEADSQKVITVASISAISIHNTSKTELGSMDGEVKLKLGLSRIDKVIDMSSMKKQDYDYLMEVTERVIFIMKKYVKIWRKKVSKKTKIWMDEKLTFCAEGCNSEVLWVQATQRKYFSEIFLALEKPKAKISAFSRKLMVSHAVFLDKDLKILRCTTRNEKATIKYSTIYPILLPSSVKNSDGVWVDCEFTRKLVLKYHKRLGHHGVPDTLASLRSEFWILKGRRFVQKILRKCVICRKVQGVAYSIPPSPPLPDFRVVRNKPFSGCGVDFLGPFRIQDTPKGKVYKSWFLSFVCGATRAVHLEAVKTRQIGDFLNALSRFMSERGIPESFISDHEGSFKRASEELEQIVKSSRAQKYLKSNRISWNFYTEKSPNKGGFLERLNSNIKRTFSKILGSRISTFEEFRTLACHVHSTVNDRPLTYIFSDIASECKALTPSMLLRGYNLNEPPHLNLRKPQDVSETKISESYKVLEKIKDSFWNLWRKQYLTDLFERHARDKRANKELVVPKLGEVCLLAEDKLPRREWRLARVVEIDEKRGVIRGVTVQTLSPGGGLITKIKRSPDKLVPLEISSEVSIEGLEDVSKKVNMAKKYSKQELKDFKRLGFWPPYKRSIQFKNPGSINVGPETNYVNKDGKYKEIELELPRHWK